jgi:hypothetical protein
LIVLLIDDLPEEEGIRIDNGPYLGNPRAFLKPKLDPDDPLNVSFSQAIYEKGYQSWTTCIDFGDGSPINNLTSNLTVHTYPSLRTYNVSYWTLFEPNYYSSKKSIRLDLTKAGNMTPVADVMEEMIAATFKNQPILLSGEGSYDIDGEIKGYYWDYGDGTHSPTDNEYSGYMPSKVTSHKYEKVGRYIVTLHVMDDLGYISLDSDIAQIEVRIRPNY